VVLADLPGKDPLARGAEIAMSGTITVTLPLAGAADIINTIEGEFSPGLDALLEDSGTGPILAALLAVGYRWRSERLIAPGAQWYDMRRGFVTD
jgi:hypothetical protein